MDTNSSSSFSSHSSEPLCFPPHLSSFPAPPLTSYSSPYLLLILSILFFFIVLLLFPFNLCFLLSIFLFVHFYLLLFFFLFLFYSLFSPLLLPNTEIRTLVLRLAPELHFWRFQNGPATLHRSLLSRCFLPCRQQTFSASSLLQNSTSYRFLSHSVFGFSRLALTLIQDDGHKYDGICHSKYCFFYWIKEFHTHSTERSPCSALFDVCSIQCISDLHRLYWKLLQ